MMYGLLFSTTGKPPIGRFRSGKKGSWDLVGAKPKEEGTKPPPPNTRAGWPASGQATPPSHPPPPAARWGGRAGPGRPHSWRTAGGTPLLRRAGGRGGHRARPLRTPSTSCPPQPGYEAEVEMPPSWEGRGPTPPPWAGLYEKTWRGGGSTLTHQPPVQPCSWGKNSAQNTGKVYTHPKHGVLDGRQKNIFKKTHFSSAGKENKFSSGGSLAGGRWSEPPSSLFKTTLT